MKFVIRVECVGDDGGTERSAAVAEFDRHELVMENLGMSLAEGKAVLEGVQEFVAAQQAEDFLRRARPCDGCGRRFPSKGGGTTVVRTAFGDVWLPNPRWGRCRCPASRPGPKTFRPLQAWLRGRTSPELLYLEAKWASLTSYGGVAGLLRDVLPVSDTLSPVTVRKHALETAERMEEELGEEKEVLFEGAEDDWERQATPDGPLTVGIDGGFVRAAHKDGFFEVIAGKSVLAFRRDDPEDRPSAKCFSFVQTYDDKPRRRLWELLKSQGMQENQEVVFLSDGGDSVRRLQEYLHPTSEHWLDWFHITMRLTVLQQQVKGLRLEQAELGEETAQDLTSIKHYLWHGNTLRALQRLGDLSLALEFPETRSAITEKVAAAVGEFLIYIRNNEEHIPNFGERYRQGEIISTAFVESTVNQVIAKRLAKRQGMRWTPRGAHLLLQVRTKVLNGELEDAFRRWHPQFRPAAAA